MTLSDLELGYLAGLIDGEGCIHVTWNAPRHRAINPSTRVKLTITNSDPRLMEWLVDHVGGRAYALAQHDNWKPRYNWHATVAILRELLPLVTPHLVLKRRQAEIAAELLRLTTPPGMQPGRIGNTTSASVLARRMELRDEMRSLNRRGVAA